MPPAGVVANAEAVLDGDPGSGPCPTLGLLCQLRTHADLGKRLFDDLLEREARHAERPSEPAIALDTRVAASAMVSSER